MIERDFFNHPVKSRFDTPPPEGNGYTNLNLVGKEVGIIVFVIHKESPGFYGLWFR
jgi:hypothetical protein